MTSFFDPFPISLRELSDLYRLTLREIDYLITFVDSSITLLNARMKPSAIVSARFNRLEAYYLSFLQHLKWKVTDLFIDEKLPIADSPHISALFEIEYEHSGVAHPIGEQELERLRLSLLRTRDELGKLLREIDQQTLRSVFMCHSSQDKEFVRTLARDLTYRGARVWVDEAEIKIGDSLIQKISEGIEATDFLAVVLSETSVGSNWVQTELRMAMIHEIEEGEKRVLPILVEDCEIPAYLADKRYADFRDPRDYNQRIEELVSTLRPEQR